MRIPSFARTERAAQAAHLASIAPDKVGFAGSPCRLDPTAWPLNLAPAIREAAPAYFGKHKIVWHRHRNHGLSSQVCCLNWLMPLTERPEALARLVAAALAIDPPEMLPVEDGPGGRPWFVGFEWIGQKDYLNEGAARTRGANATSADAILRFRHAGRVETLLIEWKYTEAYGGALPDSGNARRIGRYHALAFAPAGPVRADLGLALTDFFHEPFYQLLRQQMLAAGMQEAGEAQASRVRVLHIAPGGNQALKAVTAPALRAYGTNAFAAFGAVLADPGAFVSRTTDAVFGPLLRDPGAAPPDWADYLRDRYRVLDLPCDPVQGPLN